MLRFQTDAAVQQELVVGVIVVIASAAILGLASVTRSSWRRARDGRRIYRWLREHTRDEPSESHQTTFEISVGTRLPEERVIEACRGHARVFQSSTSGNLWSIWRREPQSIYEKRGIRSF